jgi:DNA polymerase V
MKMCQATLVKKPKNNYRVERPTQTGFSSPATHYNEPRIDLNKVLIDNPSSAFYIRVVGNSFADFNIYENDVLIIDKALIPKKDQLAIVIQDDEFKIIKIEKQHPIKVQLWGVITYIIKSVK